MFMLHLNSIVNEHTSKSIHFNSKMYYPFYKAFNLLENL